MVRVPDDGGLARTADKDVRSLDSSREQVEGCRYRCELGAPAEPPRCETGETYRRSVGQLPPVVVFETEEGLLLADGYHRLAAAMAEGQEIIEAEVRHGSRQDALAYAVTLGAAG
jgi:hypothetical protein